MIYNHPINLYLPAVAGIHTFKHSLGTIESEVITVLRNLYFYYFVDVDECQTGQGCNLTRSTCVNSIGSFRCECLPGYIPVDHKTCKRMFKYLLSLLRVPY